MYFLGTTSLQRSELSLESLALLLPPESTGYHSLFISEIGRGFPYVLAGHYLTAGIGAVLGVLCAAFATTLLRERDEGVIGMEMNLNNVDVSTKDGTTTQVLV